MDSLLFLIHCAYKRGKVGLLVVYQSFNPDFKRATDRSSCFQFYRLTFLTNQRRMTIWRIIWPQIIYLRIWYSMVMEPKKQLSVKMNEVGFLVSLSLKRRSECRPLSSRMWRRAVWWTGILKTVAEYFCRRLAPIFQVTRRHVPEDRCLHSHYFEIPKFQGNHNFYYSSNV